MSIDKAEQLKREWTDKYVIVAPESCRDPDVKIVAEIGGASAGADRDAVWNLEPVYFRPSYADEKVAANK